MRFILISFLYLFPLAGLADSDGPCGSDGPKLCKEAAFGKGSMFECLVKNKDKASQVCREHLNRLTMHRLDCAPEIKSLCAGKPFYCLLRTAAADEVWKHASKACLSSVLLNAEYITDCKAEIRSSCSEISVELPQLVACLKSQKTPSSACRVSLDR